MTTSQPVERLTYTAAEAAEALGVHPDTIRSMVRDGRLPTIDTGTKRVIIPRWAIDELVNAGRGVASSM